MTDLSRCTGPMCKCLLCISDGLDSTCQQHAVVPPPCLCSCVSPPLPSLLPRAKREALLNKAGFNVFCLRSDQVGGCGLTRVCARGGGAECEGVCVRACVRACVLVC
jgi:hypothetical protein